MPRRSERPPASGRALLGAGESFIITGAQSWGLALGGPRNTGKVLAWMGTAMYAAFALGAPAGTFLYAGYGFDAIALATTLVPLAALVLVTPLQRVPPTTRVRPALTKVLAAVSGPGIGLALSSVGFGATTAFVGLLFAARGWTVWPAFTAFAAAFILARVFFGHLADRVGGAKVALICVLIEAAGQALLWLAPSPGMALIGAALTGFGYSLAFPALCLEAVRRVPVQSRGSAIGAYVVCLDFSLASAGPVAGLLVAPPGYAAIYLLGAGCAALAAMLTVGLLTQAAAQPAAAP